MTKQRTQYTCQSCGGVASKWSGQCLACGQWDTITEDTTASRFTHQGNKAGRHLKPVDLSEQTREIQRTPTTILEFDRVLGGGLVAGSAILLGGDPGIGKSTLLLQLAAQLAQGPLQALYISGEESVNQIQLRAKRLRLEKAPVKLLTATVVKDILASLETMREVGLVIIDSIQTMFVDAIPSSPGTVSQVRASAFELISLAKRQGFTLLMVGHVTKDGQIAGPKVLEHMVDTVLYFEGDQGHQFRIIRAVKNRFGAANELGVFEMREEGLCEVNNPSALFLSERHHAVSGACVFAGIEGSRPILVEIQALVSPSYMAAPRRAVVGWDTNRLAMVIAILNTRYGLNLADKEVYLNVAGGLRVNEPAADLAVAVALISAVTDIPLPPHITVFGELGLSGEVRRVAREEMRINEAKKLGFTQAMVPLSAKKQNKSFNLIPIQHISDVKSFFKTVQQKT